MSRNDVLVDADWVQAHASDEGVVLVEVDEDTTELRRVHPQQAINEVTRWPAPGQLSRPERGSLARGS